MLLLVLWLIWAYPFLFRAPHRQKRNSITVSGPTYAGLFFEVAGISLAFAIHAQPAGPVQMAVAAIFGAIGILLAWTSVRHLGKQFRVRAGLYDNHELVRTGPYSIVRHPIYTSLLAMLSCTLLTGTPWKWMPAAVALFLIGTEIRVRTEDNLLASRFGNEFATYRQTVPAYIPFVR